MTNIARCLLISLCAVGLGVAACSSNQGPTEVSIPPTNWEEHASTSQMDGTPNVVADVKADGNIDYWLGSSTPILVFRCDEKKLSAYVVTGTAASVESGSLGMHTVRLRFDEGKPVTQQWSESTDSKALFSPTPANLERQVESAKKVRFEFVPFNANPAIASFDVRGFSVVVPRITAACK